MSFCPWTKIHEFGKNGLGNKEKIYEIRYYKWNNRYEWLNSDGSHHFAVANYIITNKNINYKIKSQITTYSIKEELKTIIDNYCMFLINDKLQYHLKVWFSIQTLKNSDFKLF